MHKDQERALLLITLEKHVSSLVSASRLEILTIQPMNTSSKVSNFVTLLYFICFKALKSF